MMKLFGAVIIFMCLISHGFASDETIEALDLSSTSVISNIVDLFRNVLNGAVKRLIESQRNNVATGWPPNIPPLDPLYIEELYIEPDEVIGFTSFQMTLNDSHLRGLEQFKVMEVDIRPLQLSAKIALSFDRLEMDGTHSTRATVLQGIFPQTLTGSGPYNMTFHNVDISLFAQFGIVEGHLHLYLLVLDFTIGSTQTNFTGFGLVWDILFNSLASVAFPAILLVQKIELNLRIYQELIPAVNEILNQITLLDLIAVIFDFLNDNGLNIIRDAIQSWVCNAK